MSHHKSETPIPIPNFVSNFVSNFVWERGKATGMFLAWFWDSQLSRFIGKIIAKIVIYDQARENTGSNYENLGQRRVLNLV